MRAHAGCLGSVLVVLLGLGGCDSGSSGGGGAGTTGTIAGMTAGSSGSSAGEVAADGGAQLGPSASIRVVNLVPDVTFDAWGPGSDANRLPVRLASNIEYATASEYFDAPVNPISQEPIFVLWKSGDAPEAGKMFSMLQDSSHERMRIEVRDLEAAGERATIIISPQEPAEEDPRALLQYSTLDETELNRGDATKLNLHISYHLEDIGGFVAPSFAVDGESCFHDGSANVNHVWSVAAGATKLGVFDVQSGADCAALTPLATLDLGGEPGDNLLITVYREGDAVKMFAAPIE